MRRTVVKDEIIPEEFDDEEFDDEEETDTLVNSGEMTFEQRKSAHNSLRIHSRFLYRRDRWNGCFTYRVFYICETHDL